jgi:hypothetical protein
MTRRAAKSPSQHPVQPASARSAHVRMILPILRFRPMAQWLKLVTGR